MSCCWCVQLCYSTVYPVCSSIYIYITWHPDKTVSDRDVTTLRTVIFICFFFLKKGKKRCCCFFTLNPWARIDLSVCSAAKQECTSMASNVFAWAHCKVKESYMHYIFIPYFGKHFGRNQQLISAAKQEKKIWRVKMPIKTIPELILKWKIGKRNGFRLISLS